jgi:hypothetical protein
VSAARWLCFAVDGVRVMVSAGAFRRTLPAPAPLPEHVEAGGERYPVVDPGRLSGVAGGAQPAQLLLLLAGDGIRLALPATEVCGTIDAAGGEPGPLPWPYAGAADWCAGVVVPPGPGAQPILALDLAALARAVAVDPVAAGEVGR